ncbi:MULTISPECIES: type II toxin-antitoxin system RelE/ParE family toxin [unclassified Caballeronia]|uniref:type II toxin-antitoxin system RelE/ParE family toxin n=1 Tax=unclassified Caballeronia TaxID=2646786 RepID=UPI002864F3C6|nr:MULTISPECIES: type II toxin-antitoxin system RelE/ParE family toxin [unclassified Caballeronia]MDR5770951.1 type II toxin-antitoxin system RelE/ParE family toxin [Caballeronia sp. LZ002]MDR5846388.1 type II toxin-antitoxin system RelE/ParE family toxin [Caballeronia sp. LZ003]
MPNDGRTRATLRTSKKFLLRLADIERYWGRVDQPQSYERMLEVLESKVMPLLRRFPAIGRPFLNTDPDTYQAILACEELIEETEEAKKRAELREHVFEDYVLLYLLIGDTVLLASIRHTKEVSFDFDHIWGPER